MKRLVGSVVGSVFLVLGVGAVGAEPGLKIVTLGDSITRGARPGVQAHETFSALLEKELRGKGIQAEVVNAGIGGERTDGALARLDRVLEHRPKLVTVMYGTNDSHVDRGKETSRLSLETYTANLTEIVERVRSAGAVPVLMTEPRWGVRAKDGLGENPNVRLKPYVEACRQVARKTGTPLVDHYAHWEQAEKAGTDVGAAWTTDQCHPNPRGHRELAAVMLPVVLKALRGEKAGK